MPVLPYSKYVCVVIIIEGLIFSFLPSTLTPNSFQHYLLGTEH